MTDPLTSSTMAAPASLRSDRDRHGVGTSDRDQIGITDHLHRNTQFALYNGKSKDAREFLEIPIDVLKGDDAAEKILKFSRAIKSVGETYLQIVGAQSNLPLNIEVDRFLEWIYDTQIQDDGPPRFWLISHNVMNDGNIQVWVDRILKERVVFLHKEDRYFSKFSDDVKEGDRCLIARGQGETKKLLACGEIVSDAEEYSGEDGVFRRDMDPFVPLGVTGLEASPSDYGVSFNPSQFGGAVPRAILELNPDRPEHQSIIELINFQIERVTGMSETNVIKEFKQVILQGPPGTGKTYKAIELARKLLGCEAISKPDWHQLRFDVEKKTGQWALVVFHPSYNYEDFLRGIKVETRNGQVHYTTADKIFCEMAKKACQDAKPHVLIIDEINRANLPAVMGELLYALEYRGEPVILPYAGETLRVPDNLYVIGTMNTADRSIGYLDYAVRRRFAFISCEPSEKVLEDYPDYKDGKLRAGALSIFRGISALFGQGAGGNLSPDFDRRDVGIGHTYFLAKTPEELVRKCLFQVQPLLREYIKDGVLRPSEGKILLEVQDKSIDLASRNAQKEFENALWQILAQ